jgi:hypothetical protein
LTTPIGKRAWSQSKSASSRFGDNAVSLRAEIYHAVCGREAGFDYFARLQVL